jgi:hypothetical protein
MQQKIFAVAPMMERNGTSMAANCETIRFARRSVPAYAPHKFSLALHPQSLVELSSP